MPTAFEKGLFVLKKELSHMGDICIKAIGLSVEALESGDERRAEEVRLLERATDHLEYSMESACMKLLSRERPVSKELRQISAILKIVSNMERIGDQAEDIAELVPFVGGVCTFLDIPLSKMAEASSAMLASAIQSFLEQNLTRAFEVLKADDKVDALLLEIREIFLRQIGAGNPPPEACLDIYMAAKYLERIGDHACNMAKWSVYSITGNYVASKKADIRKFSRQRSQRAVRPEKSG